MAASYPSDLTSLSFAAVRRNEVETLRRLTLQLSEAYAIYHNIRLPGMEAGDGAFEAFTFAVINRGGDVLLIEQFDGPLVETPKQLAAFRLQRGRFLIGRLESEFERFREIRGKLPGRRRKPRLDYLLYCPEHALPEKERNKTTLRRVADAALANRLPKKVRELLKAGRDNAHRRAIEDFFHWGMKLSPDVSSYLAAQEKTFLRLHGELAAGLDKLELHPYRLRVKGTAGSGKSLLALHFYQRLLAAGRRPLLLCYNRPLADRLRLAAPEGGVVETFYGWCHRFAESQGEKLEFPAQAREYSLLWERLLARLAELPVPEAGQFDALIVDEGQDFEADWYPLLKRFLKPGHDLIWLDDPLQDLRHEDSFWPGDCAVYHADTNYRTPRRVAEFIQEVLEIDFNIGNPLPGLGVGVSAHAYPQEQVDTVRGIVRELLDQGLDYRDMVILTCLGAQRSVFSQLSELGGVALRRFTGQYDPEGRQVLTEGELYFDSVYRFKGQQVPVVILVDVDPVAARLNRAKKILWSAMTRATLRLEICARQDNPWNRRLFKFARRTG